MGAKSSQEQPINENTMNYLNSAQYQAMYNQVYSNATSNPLQGERFEHSDLRQSNEDQNKAIPIEVKKTIAIKIEMSLDKASIELRKKDIRNWFLKFRFSCDVEIMITIYYFAFEQANPKTSITESITSEHEKDIKSFKFLPSKNADFPENTSVLSLSDNKIIDLCQVKANQFPIIIKLEKISQISQEKKIIYVYGKFIKNSPEKYSVQVLRQKYEVNGIATVAEEVYGLGASNDSSDCIICMSEKIDVIVLPCNHMCICYNCCVDFRAKNKKCPICRAPIDSFVKMEIANQNKPQIPNLQPCNPYQK